MEEQRAPVGKTLPHSRSISLQMLTRTPNTAPLKQEMYTEALRPMRSPPLYSRDSSYLEPPLQPYSNTVVMSPPHQETYGNTSPTRSPPLGERPIAARKFTGDAALANTFTSTMPRDRGARAVSMPLKPTSPWDSMFTFSSDLPDDLSRTLVVPTDTPEHSSQPPTPGLSNTSLPHSPSVSATSLYRPEGMRESYISGTRSVQGMRSTSASSSRPAKERPTGSRRPSVLNSLGNWLDKR